MQRLPIDDKRAARAFVLFRPIHQEIEASMVDVIEMLEIDVQFDIVWNAFQFGSQQGQSDECGRPLQTEIGRFGLVRFLWRG